MYVICNTGLRKCIVLLLFLLPVANFWETLRIFVPRCQLEELLLSLRADSSRDATHKPPHSAHPNTLKLSPKRVLYKNYSVTCRQNEAEQYTEVFYVEVNKSTYYGLWYTIYINLLCDLCWT